MDQERFTIFINTPSIPSMIDNKESFIENIQLDDVNSSTTIKTIKERIHNEICIPSNHQQLFFKETLLEDQYTLATYDIAEIMPYMSKYNYPNHTVPRNHYLYCEKLQPILYLNSPPVSYFSNIS